MSGSFWQKHNTDASQVDDKQTGSQRKRSINQETESCEISEIGTQTNRSGTDTNIILPTTPLSSLGILVMSRLNKQRKSISSMLENVISSVQERIMSDPERWSRFMLSSFQVGIMFYLLRTLWSTINDMVDELYQDQHRTSSSIGVTDPLFADSNDVNKLIQFLDHVTSISEDDRTSTKLETHFETPIPSSNLLQLGYKLLASGMPLRDFSSSTGNNNQDRLSNDDNISARCSIQSLLLELTRSEASILQQCLWSHEVSPDNDDDVWNNISGLDSVKERLLGTIAMLPSGNRGMAHQSNHFVQHAEAFSSLFHGNEQSNQRKSKTGNYGILLYGEPGCGKTLLVKALAQKSQLPCLVVTPSVLLRKYVGETNMQVRCLFSLASKMSPCILCIDELDGLFRERSDNEHEVSRDLKTEFLQWWDGMLTSTGSIGSSSWSSKPSSPIMFHRRTHPILVIGATNRPFDVDSAVLRRLTQSHYVGLPDVHDRFHLLTHLLKSIPKDSQLDLRYIAERTDGYTPSDLRQVLQTAALVGPLQRGMDSTTESNTSGGISGLSTSDIMLALQTVTPTRLTKQYRTQLFHFLHPSQSMEEQNETISPTFISPRRDNQQHPYTQPANKWETDYGNFYHIGTLELDQQTFDSLANIAKQMHDAAREDDTPEDE